MRIQFLAVSLLICASGVIFGQTSTSNSAPETQQQNGSVTISLQKNDLPSSVRVIEAKLERPNYKSYSESVTISKNSQTAQLGFKGVPVGAWSLSVRAKDKSGAVLYSGNMNIAVREFQTTEASVFMSPTTAGNVELSFVWGKPRIKWKMLSAEPMLQQTPDPWDSDHYYFDDPVVLKINDSYHMWYSSATNGRISEEESFWIAYATSPDGVNWTKHGAVISPGPQGNWMDMGAMSPSVIYEDGVFKMWFVGAQHFQKYRNGIGYAISTDGKTWEVERQPVVPLSQSIPIVWNPCVVKKDGLYYLYVGVCNSSRNYPTDVVLLTSVDGKNWLERGKVLSARKEISWQSVGIVPCEVIYDEHRFKMFYTGFSENSFAIGYAESTEGLNWFNTSDLPTLGLSDTPSWVTNGVGFPAVIRDKGRLKIWFSGLTDRAHGYHIGYAEQAE